MKLRNKKTGEIIETDYMFGVSIPTTETFGCKSYDQIAAYSSLAELNEEWEDYGHRPYVIDMWEDDCICDAKFGVELEGIERAKECGLYFETKEEAEKAVEKLKAWKRLKAKGFRFIDHLDRDSGQGMTRYEWDGYVNGEDLDLLFGGEE